MPSFSEPIWWIFKLLLILIFGGILFLIIHFWRIARKRDKQNEQATKSKQERRIT